MEKRGHLTNDERVAYWQGTLAPETLLEMSDHLQTCENCREELREERPAVANDEPVAYEDLVAWIDRDLDPMQRRELASRISASPTASAELLNLLQFREAMDDLPARDYGADDVVRPRSIAWLPLAAGLILGGAVFWWTAAMHNRAGQVALVDAGKQLIVRQDGTIPALGALPPDLQQSIQAAIATGEVDPSGLTSDLRGPRETLAGAHSGAATLRVVSPVGSVIETDRPVFRWSAEPGATNYRVSYLKQRSGQLTSSPVLDATTSSWMPNESLLPNDTYEWEVEALENGALLAKAPAPPAPEARFRVLAPAQRTELATLRKRFGDSHLVMGIAYARAGVLPKAQEEFAELARENPEDPLPKRLLGSLTK